MRRVQRISVLIASVALVAAGATLTIATPAVAAPAVVNATCDDGSRESAATIGKDGVQEVRTVDSRTGDGKTVLATIKLRYSAAHHCVWGLISGRPGDTVWIDRQGAGDATWKGPLGRRDIQNGNSTTYTGAYKLPGFMARACGNGYEQVAGKRRPAPIVCTGWYSEDFVMTPRPGSPAPTPVTPNMALARKIQEMNRQGRIAFNDRASDFPAADAADHSLAIVQIADLAAGLPARYSTRCDKTRAESPAAYNKNTPSTAPAYKTAPYPFAGGVPANTASVTTVLQFLVTLGSQQHITVNTLFGQCHVGPTSNHHAGQAVDLGCNDGLDAKHVLDGLTRNGETCAANGHWHYSTNGR